MGRWGYNPQDSDDSHDFWGLASSSISAKLLRLGQRGTLTRRHKPDDDECIAYVGAVVLAILKNIPITAGSVRLAIEHLRDVASRGVWAQAMRDQDLAAKHLAFWLRAFERIRTTSNWPAPSSKRRNRNHRCLKAPRDIKDQELTYPPSGFIHKRKSRSKKCPVIFYIRKADTRPWPEETPEAAKDGDDLRSGRITSLKAIAAKARAVQRERHRAAKEAVGDYVVFGRDNTVIATGNQRATAIRRGRKVCPKGLLVVFRKVGSGENLILQAAYPGLLKEKRKL